MHCIKADIYCMGCGYRWKTTDQDYERAMRILDIAGFYLAESFCANCIAPEDIEAIMELQGSKLTTLYSESTNWVAEFFNWNVAAQATIQEILEDPNYKSVI